MSWCVPLKIPSPQQSVAQPLSANRGRSLYTLSVDARIQTAVSRLQIAHLFNFKNILIVKDNNNIDTTIHYIFIIMNFF